jgi:DHA2 family multidrug resistance protein
VLRGLGMGLLFIAVTIICLGDLERAEIPHGAGLFNFGRQMGGLIGIAFLATFLDHHLAISRTGLVSNLGAGSPVVTQALQGMEQVFSSRGMSPAQAGSAAMAALDGMVNRQAAAISFNQAFISLDLLFVFAVPCLLVIKGSLTLASRTSKTHGMSARPIPSADGPAAAA